MTLSVCDPYSIAILSEQGSYQTPSPLDRVIFWKWNTQATHNEGRLYS